MNKKIITMLALLLAPFIGTFGQHMPLANVPSPEVAGLGEYGTVPVGLYTGVPDISVPLHEMKVGGQSFPLTAAYHLASVKPQMQEGCLGIGWSLRTGGYISRSVNGLYDEKMHADGYAPGYYANAYRLKGMTNEQFSAATKNIRSSDGTNTYYELVADEFSFNFYWGVCSRRSVTETLLCCPHMPIMYVLGLRESWVNVSPKACTTMRTD